MTGSIGTALLLTLAMAAAVPAPDPSYRSSLEQWRREREARLRAEDGWLSVAGLFWLEQGANTFGSGPSQAIILPADAAPERAGALNLAGRRVTVHLEAGVAATLNGQAVTTAELRPDSADVLVLGRLRLQVIERGDRFGLRMRDPEAPQRRAFTGLEWYPVQESYRVTARFVPAASPRSIPIPNVLGQVNHMPSPGRVVFTLRGRQLSLDPVLEEGSPQLFFIFRDTTAGKGTYPAGRFVYADPPKEGKVVLDFNKAYSPPCAFTNFATCPLPPKQNRLNVAISAGEKDPKLH
jgi:uncharacterized protein (DUF1684 family)